MSNGFFSYPKPLNEPVLNYRAGSNERNEVLATYKNMYSNPVTVPLYIGEEKIVTEKRANMAPPHDHKHVLGTYSLAEKAHIEDAITAALAV